MYETHLFVFDTLTVARNSRETEYLIFIKYYTNCYRNAMKAYTVQNFFCRWYSSDYLWVVNDYRNNWQSISFLVFSSGIWCSTSNCHLLNKAPAHSSIVKINNICCTRKLSLILLYKKCNVFFVNRLKNVSSTQLWFVQLTPLKILQYLFPSILKG